jgi:hypothetical protein
LCATFADLVQATSVLSVVNPRIMAKVARHTDALLPLTEQDMRCCTRFTASRYDTTPSTSSSSLRPI